MLFFLLTVTTVPPPFPNISTPLDAKAEAGAEGEAGGDPEDAFALMAELEEMMLEVEPAQEVAPAAPELSAEELAEEHRRSEVLAEELMAELMLAEEEELMAVVSGSDAPGAGLAISWPPAAWL